jgi:hypothetical protein
VQFVYNNNSIWWVNYSGQRLRVSRIAFERIGGAGRFDGGRWSQFYPYVANGGCVRLTAADADGAMARPDICGQVNVDINGNSTESFWTSGTGQFRVLWDGAEVALCEISAGQCVAFLPPD